MALACGCKLYGNQHGSWYRFCWGHWSKVTMAAKALGITVQELMARAVNEEYDRMIMS